MLWALTKYPQHEEKYPKILRPEQLLSYVRGKNDSARLKKKKKKKNQQKVKALIPEMKF